MIGEKEIAKLPIRNKSKDNPYTLGFGDDKKTYTVEFVDNKKVMHKIAISVEVYNSFELKDISQIHKFRKHIEHSEVYEETLNNRMANKHTSLEEEVESKIMLEELKCTILMK